ncbi:MAG: peptidase M15 [Rickettsiaceae bacterium]|nr:MAG: peptidase M15 [Rickettsiaceae bacterium]
MKLILIAIQILCIQKVFALPEGFVYLKDIDPTIIENLRYCESENFVGQKIKGYEANKVIITQAAAVNLAKVQKELLAEGYSLVIYDGYRPQKAVDHFIKWSQDSKDQINKKKYYPRVNKGDVFDLGYVAKKSGHSRGSTLDLTIIKSNSTLKKITTNDRKLLNNQIVLYLDDGTVDMGTSFDLFDEASHHDGILIKQEYLDMRNYLRTVMNRNGFKEHAKEWWHYTLDQEPFPDTYFDFDVK